MKRLLYSVCLVVIASAAYAEKVTDLLQRLKDEKQIIVASLNEIENERQQLQQIYEEREQELNERQISIEKRRQLLSEQKLILQERENDLNAREKSLQDRKAALAARELRQIESAESLANLKKSLRAEREEADRSKVWGIIIALGAGAVVGVVAGLLLAGATTR